MRQSVQENSTELEYAPRLSGRWRLGRRHVVAIVLIALAWCGWRASGPVWRRVELAYWSRACRAYWQPADRVVFEQEEGEIAKLMASGVRYQKMGWRDQVDPEFVWLTPGPYAHLPQAGWEPRVAFMHRLKNARGVERLVVIELNAMREPGMVRHCVFLYPRVFAASALHAGEEIRRYDDSGRISMAN